MVPDLQSNTATQEAPAAQPAPRVDQPPIAPPAMLRPGWDWLLRTLGMVVALGIGIAFSSVMLGLGGPWWNLLAWLGFVALAALAAGLLRTWWAILIVPVAVFAGIGIASGGDLGSASLLLVGTATGALGAVIGTPIGWWIARQRRR
jgi:hypothetical protein